MVAVDRRLFIAGGLAAVATPALAWQDAAPRRQPPPPRDPALRRLSPAVDKIVAPGTQIEVIATGIQWAEGPCWVPQHDYLLFSDPRANIMHKWQRGHGVSDFLSPSGAGGTTPDMVREPGSNGLALDHSGHLLLANSGGRSIDRVDLTTKQRTVVTGSYKGKHYNSPNDLYVAKDGAIWFTDPPYGFAQFEKSTLKESPINGVYRCDTKGNVTVIDGTLTWPNGISLTPDQKTLLVSVSDPQNPVIMAYDVAPGGKVSNRRVFMTRDKMPGRGGGNPDGMKIAKNGTIFCAGPGGMMILAPDATPLGIIEDGAAIANCSIGDGALYMASATRVLRMPILIS